MLTPSFPVGLLFAYTAGAGYLGCIERQHANRCHSDVHLVYRRAVTLSPGLLGVFQLELTLQ